jgi:hypothetical protein
VEQLCARHEIIYLYPTLNCLTNGKYY